MTPSTSEKAAASPEVSVVMAAFNEEASLRQAVQSVIDQTFTDWELIVVDDGSRDATDKILRELAESEVRIKHIRNPDNLGLPTSLNRGLQAASGRYIARADADDVNLPNRLEEQIDFLNRHPDIDVVGTGAFLIDARGRRVNSVALAETHEELASQHFLKTHFIHPSVMIRRRFFDKIGFYDPLFVRVEDKELWLRGLKFGSRYANIQMPLIEYTTNDYVRSWSVIYQSTKSKLLMVRKYNIKNGYRSVGLSLVLKVLNKVGVRKPRALRVHADSEAMMLDRK